MDTAVGRAARRELGLVLCLAACGIALAVLVAFAPWYQPVVSGGSGAPAVVQTYPPVDAGGAGAGGAD
ncbi:MAG TPA: hypothetical protein VF657_04260 [Actinoplanes sp.]